MSIKSNVVEEALRLADEPAQPKQAPQTPNAEHAREIADALDRVMAEPREVGRPLACAAAPPPLHDETVPMREYDEDDYNIRRYEPVLRGATIRILAAVIIAVVMMWPITNIFRSYVERPTPTIPAFDPDRGQSSSEAPQAAQSAPAPLLTDAARTAAGDGLASLPDPSLKGPLALPPGDAPPPAATPTKPAETALNAPAVASEAAAVTDSAQSVATAASSEAVTPGQQDRLTEIGPATRSIAPVGPVPLPRARPVPVPSSPPSSSPLLAYPVDYGYQPGLESVH